MADKEKARQVVLEILKIREVPDNLSGEVIKIQNSYLDEVAEILTIKLDGLAEQSTYELNELTQKLDDKLKKTPGKTGRDYSKPLTYLHKPIPKYESFMKEAFKVLQGERIEALKQMILEIQKLNDQKDVDKSEGEQNGIPQDKIRQNHSSGKICSSSTICL
jgi:hypothetical protein